MAVNIHLSPSAGGSVSYSYAAQNKIVFTLTVNSGYTCTAYRYFNAQVDTGLVSRSIKGPTTVVIHGQSFDPDAYGSHNLFVYFNNAEPGGGGENTYTVRAYANSEYGGEATVEPKVYYGVSIGTNKTFKFRATAFDGYIFDYWVNDKTDTTRTSNPLLISVASPSEPGDYYISYTACFRLAETYKFTASVDPSGGGTVNGLEKYEHTFKEGEEITVSVEAVPNEGYAFVRWRKKDTTIYKYPKVLEITISSSQEWIAEFSDSPSINVAVKIIPNGTDHGPHGLVSIRKNRTQEVFEMENSKNLLLYPNSPGDYNVGLEITIKAYDGYKAVLIRKRMDKNSGYYIVSIPSNPYSFSNTVSDGASIEVFFGCGKILYEKETGKLLEHNGKLVYCG